MISTEDWKKLSVLNTEIRFAVMRRKECKLSHERDLPLAGHIGHTQNSAFERSRAYKKFSKSILKNHIQTKNIIFFKFYVRASSSYIRIERVVQAPPGYPCLGPAADPTESVLCSGSVGGFEKSPANCPVD